MDKNKNKNLNEAPNNPPTQDSDFSNVMPVLNKETGANDATTLAHMGSRTEATSSSSWDAAGTSSSDESLNDWTIVTHPYEEQCSSLRMDQLIEGYVCIGENLPSNCFSSYNSLHEDAGPNSQMQNPAPLSNSMLFASIDSNYTTIANPSTGSSASLSPEVESVVDNTSIPEQAIEYNGPPTNSASSSTSQSTDAAPNSRMQNPAPVSSSVVSTTLQSNTSIDYLGYGRHVQPLHEGDNSSAWAHGASSQTPPTYPHSHLLPTHQGDYSSMWADGANSRTVPTYTPTPQVPPGFRPQQRNPLGRPHYQSRPQGDSFSQWAHGTSSRTPPTHPQDHLLPTHQGYISSMELVPIYPSTPHLPPGFGHQQSNPLVPLHFHQLCPQVPPPFRPRNTKDKHSRNTKDKR